MGQSKDHAVLSPSRASRWLACTPSARLEEQFPDSSGDAAREGTLAHSISENMLRFETGVIDEAAYKLKFSQLKVMDAGEFYNLAMHEYCQQYVTFVLEQLSEARAHTKDAKIFIEKKLDLTDYAKESFGTGDAGIIANTTLIGIDLKYGKGVEVSAVNNPQMMLYALGWLREYDVEYDITEVRMIIFQPRMDNFSEWTIPVSELLLWAETELKPKAALAFAGEGDFVVGKHCQFCKIKAQCKALANYNLEIAKYEFKEPVLLNDGEVADILNRVDGLVKWANSIGEHALHEATANNKKWPGYKLVEGRSNRMFNDEDKVVATLKAANWPEDSIYNKKLIGFTALEKLVGGTKPFNELLGPYISKPPGKPALVPETDKRPEYSGKSSAADDFAE